MKKKSPGESSLIRFFYQTQIGRILLKGLTKKSFTSFFGKLLNTRISSLFIPLFVMKNGIDLKRFKSIDYHSFNDFFIREMRQKPIVSNSGSQGILFAPCEGSLLALPASSGQFWIKNTYYELSRLLGSQSIADHFSDGQVLIFRLSPKDYHRYHFLDEGSILWQKTISGKLHTVKPIAVETLPVFVENCREVTLLATKNFGEVVQVEVGALLVGKINNHKNITNFDFFQEKGYFEFGGSTILLIFKKNMICLEETIRLNSSKMVETPVTVSQILGRKVIL
ncbi:Phosphatidylserine decarboxylase proenzyme [Enterococcus casseliflavus]|uniref:phosphatidylserine decarboxylase n=1 Tax=Enterococcus casseliflavus TaxID=37734 RepID=UPI000E04371A|nr:phosphatidylserine decarboxylase [Enterococcus casseliflavus]GEB30258.1 phosphatidylserine decarboxylase proenzyme 2 [Enterococcus casseliflavus]STP35410.1 Phosphatidylserine decarboxylase proenzyme [Enterococcus casseliflavus]